MSYIDVPSSNTNGFFWCCRSSHADILRVWPSPLCVCGDANFTQEHNRRCKQRRWTSSNKPGGNTLRVRYVLHGVQKRHVVVSVE